MKKTHQPPSDIASQLCDYLAERRTCSAENLALKFNLTLDELHPVLKDLEANQKLRIAQKRCGGSCSSCDTCPSGATAQLENAIVISMMLRRPDDE